ncbi:Hypothetical predicted protein [Octopus vulgaris]|uniref:Uncharacterized protein n=2 Tax=Octopus TaxID=6643 RepID=A0AA36AK06_OCTVU|nr:Hypothetical predicted protein [Octopus vulgaris]
MWTTSKLTLFILIGAALFFSASTMRYRTCAEGCCPHEYCAYHRICYPKIHCHFGCPDGSCQHGVCLPDPPCHKRACGMGNSCSMNFNLGYNTCQYNLDIGSTLCVDRYGHAVTSAP